MHEISTPRMYGPRSKAFRALSLIAAVVTVILLMAGTQVAMAATGPNFPRTMIWWPDTGSQTVTQIANTDYVALQQWDISKISALRVANPALKILGSTNAREVNYYLADYNHAVNVELRSVSTDWMLTQVGTTLTSDVTASQTNIPVADTTKFKANQMVLVDHELMYVTAVNAGSLTVMARGPVNPPAAHTAGTRIAAVVSNWTGSITMDVSTNCPKRDVGDGNGPETWVDWNVKRGMRILTSADWDGLLIDCYEPNPSWMVSGGNNASIDPLRTNVPVTDGYAAFNTAWNTGAAAYGNALRAAAGTKILIGNGNYRLFAMNGTIYEEFPTASTAPSTWNLVFIGPYSAPHASYAEWIANGTGPNLTTFQVYGAQTNYQLMRYGLTSTLMNDGYYSYALSSTGHAHNGIWNYDEYDNAGKGRGYLGQPTGAAYAVGAAYRRDFQNGTAIVNPSSSAVTVSLGGTFQKIKGTQDPTVNDGSLVTQVTIPSHDGIILLRTAPADTVAPVTTSDAVSTYTSSATIHLSATDNVGVTATYYTLDGGTKTAGTTVSTTALGTHTLTFWSVDAAGNVETAHTVTFTVAAPAPTVLISAPATTITYGQSTTLDIAVAPAGQFALLIQARASSTAAWTTIATPVTAADGTLQFAVTPSATTQYQVVLAASGIVSNQLTINVKAATTLKTSKGQTKKNGTVVLSGSVATASTTTFAAANLTTASLGTPSSGVSIALQRRVNGRWVTIRRPSLSSTGRYSVSVKLRTRGSYVFRLVTIANPRYATATSAAVRVSVR